MTLRPMSRSRNPPSTSHPRWPHVGEIVTLLRARILLLTLLTLPWASPGHAQWASDGVSVCTAASNQFNPSLLPDGAGGAFLAWFDYRNGTSADIFAHRILASGVRDPGWPTEGRAICTAIRGQLSPVLASDGLGGSIVAWHDFRGGNTCDVYAQHLSSSGAVDPAWPADGRALTTASDDQVTPVIVSDGAGGAIVAWTDYSGGPTSDIRAQRVLANGTLAPGWPANGRVVCSAAGNQSVPCIASDGAGGAVVVWSDLRGSQSDLYVHHVLASGALDAAFPADGAALCAESGNQSGPVITAADGGGFLVAWHDYRSALDADVYAHRLLPSGAVDGTWPGGGRKLCGAVGEQYATGLAPDGAGGAIVVWYDYRDGEEADVYVQRVRSTGVVDPDWPTDGRALSTHPGDQVTPRIVGDGAGGAYAAWHDYRNGSTADIYAHHVLATGALDPAWPPEGHALCLAPGEQHTPGLAVDGAGGMIAAWTDFRGGVYSDLYAQRVFAGGAVAEVHPNALRIGHGPHPNPTRGAVDLSVELRSAGALTAEVLDLAGRRIRSMARGKFLPVGVHRIRWDGNDDLGGSPPNGVYFVRVVSPEVVRMWRIALTR
jgi:hypothetical protein